MPKCEVRPALTTPGLTLPKFGDRSPSTMRPLLPKFGEPPHVTSSMLTKSRDRPLSMSESHILTGRGHVLPSTPLRRTLPNLPVRLTSMSMQRLLLMLVVTCWTMRPSNAGKSNRRIMYHLCSIHDCKANTSRLFHGKTCY